MTDGTAVMDRPRTNEGQYTSFDVSAQQGKPSEGPKTTFDTIVGLRKKLNLPDSSPLPSVESIAEEKSKTVDAYIDTLKDPDNIYKKGMLDKVKRTREMFQSHKTRMNRFEQVQTLLSLKMAGLQDAAEKLAALEDSTFSISPASVRKKPYIEGLKMVTAREIATGVDRLQTLGIYDTTFDNPLYVGSVKAIANLSDEKYKELCDALNISCLSDSGFVLGHMITSPAEAKRDLEDLVTIRKIAEQGGLDEKQKIILTSLRNQNYLTERTLLSGSTESGDKRQLHLSECLAPTVDSARMELISTIIEDEAYYSVKSGRTFFQHDSNILMEILQNDASEQLLTQLQFLIHQGVDCSSLYTQLLGRSYGDSGPRRRSPVEMSEVAERVEKVFTAASNPENIEWAGLVQEITHKEGEPFHALKMGDLLQVNVSHMEQRAAALALIYDPAMADANPHNTIGYTATVLWQEPFEGKRLLEQLHVVCSQFKDPFLTAVDHMLQKKGIFSPDPSPIDLDDFTLLTYMIGHRDEAVSFFDPTTQQATQLFLVRLFEGGIPLSDEEKVFWYQNSPVMYHMEPRVAFKHYKQFNALQIGNILNKYPNIDIDSLKDVPSEFVEFFRATQPLTKAGWFSLRDYLVNNIDRIHEFRKDGNLQPIFFREAAMHSEVDAESVILYLRDENVFNTLPETEKQYWSFWQQFASHDAARILIQAHSHEVFAADGTPSHAFFRAAVRPNVVLGETTMARINNFLTDELLATFPADEQEFFRFWKGHNSQRIKRFAQDKKDNFQEYVVNGVPTPKFLREYFVAYTDYQIADAVPLLRDEVLSTFPADERRFWEFWIELPQENGLARFALENPDFNKTYRNADGTYNGAKLEQNFTLTNIARPERMRQWEELSSLFGELQNHTSGDTRAAVYLRIAAALSTQQLTERTEVESLDGLQIAFSQLYHDKMTPMEKRAWSILKKQLPFSTDNRIMMDMKDQAVVVERRNYAALSWVHQAVHNYVRAQTPDYIRALKTWIVTGTPESRLALQKFAEFYTPDSQPPASMFDEAVRQRLQNALPAIVTLVNLTEKYYEIQPDKITRLLDDIGDPLPSGLDSDLRIAAHRMHVARETRRPEMYVPFLKEAASIRQQLLSEATWVTRQPHIKSQLLGMDAVVSSLFKTSLVEYQTIFLEPRIKNGTLTVGEMREAIQVLEATLQCGILEGEITGFTQSLNALKRLTEPGLGENVEKNLFHVASLMLAVDKDEMNKDWGAFNQVAQEEMVAMLVRSGKSSEDAMKQVVMEDLVKFEKFSYKFAIEPFLDLILENKANIGPYAIDVRSAFEEILGYKTFITPDHEEAYGYFGEFKAEPIPRDLDGAHRYLSRLAARPEMQANQLCDMLIKGFYDPATGNRTNTRMDINGENLLFVPFSIYGADGVLIFDDNGRVEDPFKKMQQLFKKDIVPAMMHNLREGD